MVKYEAISEEEEEEEEKEEEEDDPLLPLRRELEDLKTDDEGFFYSKPERQPEVETPVRKRAKNKIDPALTSPTSESRYAHLLVKSESEEETPEEQVSIEYLEALH